MKACRLLSLWCFGLILVPCFSFGQPDIHSNIPLNEINAHAWRHFHRLFPAVAGQESWFYSAEGYQVTFLQKDVHYMAYFDPRGAYRYSLHHYAGKEIPRGPGDILKRKYPDYQLNIVTEITDGNKIIYLVRLVSPNAIKTVSLCEGEINVIGEEAINDPFLTGPSTPANDPSTATGLTSLQSGH